MTGAALRREAGAVYQRAMTRLAALDLPSPDATAAFAAAFAPLLGPGDVLLLAGPIGAGKTHFARALIQARLPGVLEVPSPSYTLVQTYGSGVDTIWHADLYRLGDPSEAAELGLEEAFAGAIALVEWPDRLPEPPPGALTLTFAAAGDPETRHLTVEGEPARWAGRLPVPVGRGCRAALRDALLDRAGWGSARAEPLAGDASLRRYERLRRGEEAAVLMDAPPDAGEDVRPFLAIARHLAELGLSAPRVLAADEGAGFLLLEDLGDDLYARLLSRSDEGLERALYQAAVDLLAELHRHPAPAGIAAYGPEVMADRAALAWRWYRRGVAGDAGDAAGAERAVRDMLEQLAPETDVLVLRDYHAENLLWLPEREGVARVGLLDFQDALAGHRAYDLVSLLEDARRDVAAALREAMIARYIAATGLDEASFRAAAAALGAQRNLRIIGVFARLSMHYGRPRYVDLIPRVWAHLGRDLDHPWLEPLRRVAATLPEPTPERLARLKELCATVPAP